MTSGYAGKILRLDLTKRSVSIIDTGQYEQWGGGHGIGSAIFWDLCKDKTMSGFDPRNVVTIMSSPLAGTLSPSAGRCEVQGIGPQGYPTEWFTRSNFGGRFAAQLKYAGYDGIVIEGRADAPVWVNVVNDQITFEDASSLWGLDTKETQQEIWRRVTGDRLHEWREVGITHTTQKPAVLCIGPAGENLSRIAVLMHDGANAAGQGGFGGVFGAKNLKAISVLGTGGVRVANAQALIEAWLWHRGNFEYNVDAPRHRSPIANAPTYGPINNMPGSQTLVQVTEASRPQACQGCWAACRRRTVSSLANESHCMSLAWPLYTLSSAEKSRVSTLGSSRLHVADQLDRYGLNSFELLAGDFYLITLYGMGVLGPGKTIECDLPFEKWGTLEFKEAFMRMIARREGIGNDLAEGIARAAERWGRFKEDSGTGVLTHAFWGYFQHMEPRAEVDFSYGSLMGERDINEHSFSRPLHVIPDQAKLFGIEPVVSAEGIVKIISTKVLPYEGDPFMFDHGEGPTGIYSASRAKTIAWHRHYTRFWSQSLGYCDFLWPNFFNINAPDTLGATPEGEPKFFNAVTGKGISFVDGMEAGRKIWNLDRAIWILQGRHRDMEVFSEYVYTQPVSRPWYLPIYENGEWKYSDCIGRILDRARFEEWKTRYYELEGWDINSGWPTRSTLEELGLGKVADELQRKEKLGG